MLVAVMAAARSRFSEKLGRHGTTAAAATTDWLAA